MFGASDRSKGSSKKGGSKKDVECFNCHKKGHYAADCWAKGGGKEGQGPRNKKKKESASSAKVHEADGIWAMEDLGEDVVIEGECWADEFFEDVSSSEEQCDLSDEIDDLPALQTGSNSSDDENAIPTSLPTQLHDLGSAHTRTFMTAMLANEEGGHEDVTKLYDSGASHHMSPYQQKFLNFMSIIPKTIMAADNGTFDAIG